MASSRKPWQRYKVGNPSTRSNFTNPDCVPFNDVTHVSHVDEALRIIAAGKLRKGLVFDESVLNTERVLVNWLSPNHWVDGFRYGNVAFTFEFAELVRNKNYYWVEAIEVYRPHACRILITSNDRSAQLQPYDPSGRDGPWWHDRSTNTHYYNGTFCLEFMLESDLAIKRVKTVDFVAHHQQWCSVHRTAPKSCTQLGLSSGQGGATFLMTAAARAADLSALAAPIFEEGGQLSSRAKHALRHIVPRRFGRLTFLCKVKAKSDTGKAVARAVLNAIAADQLSEADSLAALFRSEDKLMVAIADVLAESLGWEEPTDILKVMLA
jgi:hypothetical protein